MGSLEGRGAWGQSLGQSLGSEPCRAADSSWVRAWGQSLAERRIRHGEAAERWRTGAGDRSRVGRPRPPHPRPLSPAKPGARGARVGFLSPRGKTEPGRELGARRELGRERAWGQCPRRELGVSAPDRAWGPTERAWGQRPRQSLGSAPQTESPERARGQCPGESAPERAPGSVPRREPGAPDPGSVLFLASPASVLSWVWSRPVGKVAPR